MFIARSHCVAQAVTIAIAIIPHSFVQCQIGAIVEVGGAVASHFRTGAVAEMVISSPRQVLHTVGGRRTRSHSRTHGERLGIHKLQQRRIVLAANVDEDAAGIMSVAAGSLDHNQGSHLCLSELYSQKDQTLTTMVELLGAKPSPSVE